MAPEIDHKNWQSGWQCPRRMTFPSTNQKLNVQVIDITWQGSGIKCPKYYYQASIIHKMPQKMLSSTSHTNTPVLTNILKSPWIAWRISINILYIFISLPEMKWNLPDASLKLNTCDYDPSIWKCTRKFHFIASPQWSDKKCPWNLHFPAPIRHEVSPKCSFPSTSQTQNIPEKDIFGTCQAQNALLRNGPFPASIR